MIDFLPGIIGAVTAISWLHYTNNTVSAPDENKPKDNRKEETEVKHRLNALKEFLDNKIPFDGRTESIRARKIYFETGVRYHFHYASRQKPFLTLTYEKSTHTVHKTYIYEPLLEEKVYVKTIVQELIKRIQEEQRPKKTIEQQLEKLIKEIDFFDVSYVSPHVLQLKIELEKILTTYRSLQPETKKQHEETFQTKVDEIVHKIKQLVKEAEQRKVESVQKRLNKIDRLLEKESTDPRIETLRAKVRERHQ